MEAEELIAFLKESAKEKMLAGKADPTQKVVEGVAKRTENETAHKLAEAFNTNRTYPHRVGDFGYLLEDG